jgi:hypothetical protein
MATFNPIDREATLVGNVYLTGHNRDGEAIAVCDPKQLFLLSKALDVVNGDSTASMTIIVRFPVFQEVANVSDVNASTWNLPKPGMGWLATGTWLAFVTSLLEELAS